MKKTDQKNKNISKTEENILPTKIKKISGKNKKESFGEYVPSFLDKVDFKELADIRIPDGRKPFRQSAAKKEKLTYQEDILKSIFIEYATTDKPLSKIVEGREGYPSAGRLFSFICSNSDAYEVFKECQKHKMECFGDSILNTVDELDKIPLSELSSPKVQALKLQIDTKKWLMSKLHAERYGENAKPLVNIEIKKDSSEEIEKILQSVLQNQITIQQG